jgi:hypothetical protein
MPVVAAPGGAGRGDRLRGDTGSPHRGREHGSFHVAFAGFDIETGDSLNGFETGLRLVARLLFKQMSTRLKAGALVVVLLGFAVLFRLQRQQITRLMEGNADLGTQLNQMASLRDSNEDLVGQLKGAAESSQANRDELMRLRGQGVRLRQLEQENMALKAQRQQRGGTASALEYRNEQYGFGMTFPSDWSGYSEVADTWQGRTTDEQGETTGTYTGPEIILRHPQWTEAAPWQDIPVMVFTHDEWALVDQQKLGVSAAPTTPGKLGENAKFVFALPPRWIGFVDTLGQDEAGKVPETFTVF